MSNTRIVLFRKFSGSPVGFSLLFFLTISHFSFTFWVLIFCYFGIRRLGSSLLLSDKPSTNAYVSAVSINNWFEVISMKRDFRLLFVFSFYHLTFNDEHMILIA